MRRRGIFVYMSRKPRTTPTKIALDLGRELAFFAEDQFNRDLVKAEFGADLIHQVALVGKVDSSGLGDKEDKCWRLYTGLRGVRDAHGPVLKACHRVFPDGSFDQIV